MNKAFGLKNSKANSTNLSSCSRCLYDSSIPEIIFNEMGVCNFCITHDELEKQYPLNEIGQKKFERLIKKVKKSGYRKKYDCIIGISGGKDSTYTLYKSVQLGLRPLAVHFDNGWNSEIAVNNIQKVVKKYDIDLVTVVADWEEFKDLQLSFLKASVSDAEIPTDVAFHGALIDVAAKEKLKYIFIGHSFRTEGIVPKGWTYMDGKYVASVHKKFGKVKIKSFSNLTLLRFIYFNIIKQIKIIPFLNYMNYDKEIMGKEIEKTMDWVDYGGHHFENIYSKFFHYHFLPKKFGIDKRKLVLSAKIRSLKISKEEAIEELEKKPIEDDPELIKYTISKLGLTHYEYQKILQAPIKTFNDYPTYYNWIIFFKLPLKFLFKLGVLPKLLYYKFVA